jgi:ribosomal-protein-alanine N-acetyltransferase
MPEPPESPIDLRRLVPFEADDVRLRHWEQEDLYVVAAASIDRYIPTITTVPRYYTDEAGRDWLLRQNRHLQRGTGCPLTIARRSDNRAVGFAGINGISWEHRRASVGYWVERQHRGRGYAAAALTMLPLLARRMGLVRLDALVEPDNSASLWLCKQAGFAEEGVLRSYFRLDGRQRDMVMLSLLLDE